MKTGLTISLLINLILFGCLAVSLKTSRRTDHEAAAPAAAPAVAPAASVVAAPKVTESSAVEPFRWKQLESTNDYHVYVANLRAFGCPEISVRAIVMADVNSVFYKMRTELHEDGTEPGPWSAQNETRLVSNLLGEPAAHAPLTAEARRMLPLAFQDVDLNALGLSAEEKTSVKNLRQQFLEEIGPQNPSDPAYYKRWQQAKSEVDASLRDMIGGQTYQDYQAAAMNGGIPPTQGP